LRNHSLKNLEIFGVKNLKKRKWNWLELADIGLIFLQHQGLD